jgi:hypothetical protein
LLFWFPDQKLHEPFRTSRLVHIWHEAMELSSAQHVLINIHLWPAITGTDNTGSCTGRPIRQTQRRQTQNGFKSVKVVFWDSNCFFLHVIVSKCNYSLNHYRLFHFPSFSAKIAKNSKLQEKYLYFTTSTWK